jgi:2-methylisocitrate lyase-like PEP mutase family enzyme
MNQNEKAKRFAELHMKGAPLLLYNAWDAGSAKSILEAGAPAIATSSWSVAEAQGYRDGEAIPIELAEQIIGRIAATIDKRTWRPRSCPEARSGNSIVDPSI